MRKLRSVYVARYGQPGSDYFEQLKDPNISRSELVRIATLKADGEIQNKPTDRQILVAALATEYFPKTRPETWSAALYEGVHIYFEGSGKGDDNFANAVKSTLLLKAEWEKIKNLNSTEKLLYCEKIKDWFPARLR